MTNQRLRKLTNDYIKSLQRAQNLNVADQFFAAAPPRFDFGDIDVGEAEGTADPGIGSRILDIISRPLYGSSNVVKNVVKTVQGDPDAGDPLSALWRGVSGQDKNTYADVVGEAFPDAPDLVKGGVGLVGDILLDPVNALAGGAVGAIRGGARARKAVQALETANSIRGNMPSGMIQAAYEQTPLKATAKLPRRELPREPAAIPGESIVNAAKVSEDLPPIGNRKRLSVEDMLYYNFRQNGYVNSATSDAAKVFDAEIGKRFKRPSFADEIDPDDYQDAMNLVINEFKIQTPEVLDGVKASRRGLVKGDQDFGSINPRQLMKMKPGLGYRDATRYLTLMEKDGILGRTSRMGHQWSDGKISYDLSRHVKNPQPPQTSILAEKILDDDIRADAVRKLALQRLTSKFEDDAAKGITPVVTAVDGTEFKITSLDIFNALPDEVLNKLQFGSQGPGRNLYPSQWHAGAAEALRADLLGVPWGDRPRQVLEAMKLATHPRAKRAQQLITTGALDEAANEIVKATPNLAKNMFATAKRFAKKDLADAEIIADVKIKEMSTALEISSTAHAIESLADVGSDLQKAAREIGATDNAAVLAAQAIGNSVAKVVPEADMAAAKTAKKVASTRLKEGSRADLKVKREAEAAQAVIDRDSLALARAAGVNVEDIGVAADVRLNGAIDRMINPFRVKMQFGYGTGPLAQAFRSGESRAQAYNIRFRELLGKVAKKHHPTVIDDAYSLWRTGVKRSQITDPRYLAAFDDMAPIIDATIGNGLTGRLWRNGASVEAVNKALKDAGLTYGFEPLKKGETWTDLANQARKWDLKDPLSDLEKINLAAGMVEAKQVVGRDFIRQFGSLSPKPGWIKLKPAEYPTMGDFLQPVYVSPDAARYMKMLDEMVAAPTSFRGERGGIAWAMNNVVDPAMRWWKPFVTIVRPGHHVRNAVSDAVLNYMYGVKNPKHYQNAAEIVRAGRSLTKEGIKGLEALNGGPLRSGSDTLVRVSLAGGKQSELSAPSLYQLMNREGLFIGHQVVEDFMEPAGRITTKVMNSKYMRGLGKVSEFNTAYMRAAQVSHILSDAKFTKKFKTIEEAAHAAAIETRYWHPDVLGLTPWERKNMRRIFPFYSWFRQALPLVALTLVNKPGRVSAVPKAMYNMSIAAGVNPNEFTDPFPTDRLYPSFVTDHLTGPLFGQIGVNFGTPAEAFLGDIANGNPARNLLSMLNPVAKAPIELLSNSSIGTGATIRDKSDYFDQLIPGVNQVANITGYSPTGLGAPQAAVEMGEKTPVANLQLINFLLGFGLQNYDRPSYQTIATRERTQ